MTLDELIAAVTQAANDRATHETKKAAAVQADQDEATALATFQGSKNAADQAYSAFFGA